MIAIGKLTRCCGHFMKRPRLFPLLILNIMANWKSGLGWLCVMSFPHIVEHGSVLTATLTELSGQR